MGRKNRKPRKMPRGTGAILVTPASPVLVVVPDPVSTADVDRGFYLPLRRRAAETPPELVAETPKPKAPPNDVKGRWHNFGGVEIPAGEYGPYTHINHWRRISESWFAPGEVVPTYLTLANHPMWVDV